MASAVVVQLSLLEWSFGFSHDCLTTTLRQRYHMSASENEVSPALLRWKCDPDILPFESTAEIDPARGVVGQPTAYEALKFGIQCLAHGQNVYVRGARGTGRITMVRQMLKELQPPADEKRDFCYVHNFSRPDHPSLITLPPGSAHDFRREMGQVAEFLEEGLAKALESEPHLSNRLVVQDRVKAQIRQTTQPLEDEIKANGMALISVQQGPVSQTSIMALVDGNPVSHEQLRSLVEQDKATEEQLTAFEKGAAKVPEETSRNRPQSQRVDSRCRERSIQIE